MRQHGGNENDHGDALVHLDDKYDDRGRGRERGKGKGEGGRGEGGWPSQDLPRIPPADHDDTTADHGWSTMDHGRNTAGQSMCSDLGPPCSTCGPLCSGRGHRVAAWSAWAISGIDLGVPRVGASRGGGDGRFRRAPVVPGGGARSPGVVFVCARGDPRRFFPRGPGDSAGRSLPCRWRLD